MAAAASRLERVATLHPASFALVMATGIVSIACRLQGQARLAGVLFAANLAFYLVLWGLTLTRVVRFRDRVLADLNHHGRAVGFFTTVAATCVLGSQTWLLGGAWRPAAALWALGILLWAVLTYSIFTALTIKKSKPTLEEGIHGGWLLAVVAAQSVSVLGSQLASGFGEDAPRVLFFCLAMWLGGGMLYIWIISLIFYRYTFFVMSPADLAPPYWINMGAVAISTLAGTSLAGAAEHAELLREILPFLRGFTLLFWATATWWIPMLLILGVWRHVVRRHPIHYDTLYWGAVFPLGMYSVCTFRLSQWTGTPFLPAIARTFLFIAFAAWAAAFIGMARQLVSSMRRIAPEAG
jgi:tellurite resistance protein TehA-like permease